VKRRRQHPQIPQVAVQPQTAATPSLPVGRYPTSGVPPRNALGPLQVLPRPLPNPIPDIVRRVRENRQVPTDPVRSPSRGRISFRPRLAMLAVERRKLYEVPAPSFRREQPNPCMKRASRRRAVFASGKAGRRWTGGGPRMYNAYHNPNTRFSCG